MAIPLWRKIKTTAYKKAKQDTTKRNGMQSGLEGSPHQTECNN